ncbi:MAG: type II and III secretion system protein family protein [Alphaproteobacteria bacterium]|nr:type II and III secretion system protein family protein [Alphaproteobacteria bacterium]
MSTKHILRFAGFALAAAVTLGAPPLAAADRTPKNTMLVEIDPGKSHMTRTITLGLGKAALVKLPVDASDILVAKPEVVDAVVRTPRTAYILGQSVGQSNAFFFDAAGQQILSIDVRVERDLDPLKELVTRLVPGSRVDVEALNDTIVLRGTVPNTAASNQASDLAARFVGKPENVLNLLSISSGEQVHVKVRVAEMQRTVAKQLGIDLRTVFDVGEVNFDLATANPFSVLGQFLGSEDGTSIIDSADRGEGAQSVIRALERHGLLRTLAEPTLTAISGEAADFLAGGEFPVPVARDQEGNVIIEYKPFGVGLGFTPVVLSDGRISLRISTEVSELTTDNAFVSNAVTTIVDGVAVTVPGITIPALSVRRAQTTVELPSGGSLVMAGLLKQQTQQNIDGIPGLKDVPVLGPLFRSRDFRNNETELVVIVTPYLVTPTSPAKLQAPTDGYVSASDLETILLGRLNAVYSAQDAEKATRAVPGAKGYIID